MTMKTIIWIMLLLQISLVCSRTTEDQPKGLLGIPSIKKTSFSCKNHATGYYADVETGCQAYHMCDDQGRQYTYDCPEETLFQQRMLICDHWYMVDCSFAESNYGFNSLIGQRDQQFVSDKDNDPRTPRPDLLDRSYATKNDGESFRKHSILPALQNAISGINLLKNVNRKYENSETQASSRILPPQINIDSLDPTSIPASEDFPLTQKNNERRNANPQSVGSFQSPQKPVVRTFDPDKNFKAFEHIFQPGKTATHQDYDFSRYFTKKENGVATTVAASRFNNPKPTFVTTRKPFVNQQTTTKRVPPTIKQIVTARPTAQPIRVVKTTTVTTRKTTQVPITQAPRVNQNAFNQQSSFNQKNPVPSTVTTKAPIVSAFNQNKLPATRLKIEKPSLDLLPPHEFFKTYNDVTEGPPIYYEWKVPDSWLVPPKFDNETDGQSKHNTREIQGEENDIQSSETRRVNSGNANKIEYKDIQKLLSIPEFELPIESDGRDGYENAEAVNSFQVKIPYRQASNQKAAGSERYYYLEHAHCNPECHPHFFKPGRCEPCVKF